jgi:hypothetical protein
MFPPWKLPPVPKITINENTYPLFRKNHVRFSSDTGDVGPEFYSCGFSQKAKERLLEAGILRPYSRHQVGALFSGEVVFPATLLIVPADVVFDSG